MKTDSPPWKIPLMVAAVIGAALLPLGCSKCGGPEPNTPKTPAKRVEQMAASLPADTSAVATVGDMEAFVAGISNWKARLESLVPGTDLLTGQLKLLAGVDPFSLESWKEAGIGAEGGLSVALVDSHPVLLAFVENRQSFERTLLRRAGRLWEIAETPKTTSIGDHPVKMSQKKGDQLAWTYLGKMALVVFPAVDVGGSGGAPTVSKTMGRLLGMKDAESLSSDGGFGAFTRDFERHHNALFADPSTVLEMVGGGWNAQSLMLRMAVATVLSPVSGVGATFDGGDETVGGRLWLGFGDEQRETLAGLGRGEGSASWSHLDTERAFVGLQSNVDWAHFWSTLLDTLPEARSRDLRRKLKRWGDDVGLDAQKDLVDPFTGGAALFVYDVGPNVGVDSLLTDPTGQLGYTETVAGFEFESPESVANLRQKLVGSDSNSDTMKVPGVSARLVFADDRVYVVSSAVDEASFRDLLEGDPSGDERFGAKDLVAGFGELERLEAIASDRLPPDSTIRSFISEFSDAKISLSAEAGALVFRISIAQ